MPAEHHFGSMSNIKYTHACMHVRACAHPRKHTLARTHTHTHAHTHTHTHISRTSWLPEGAPSNHSATQARLSSAVATRAPVRSIIESALPFMDGVHKPRPYDLIIITELRSSYPRSRNKAMVLLP